MKKIKSMLALVMALAVMLMLPISASAATVPNAPIDFTKVAALSLYNYDMTRAAADGVWDTSSYVSTGIYDQNVNDVLGNPAINNHSATTNLANGYAIKGSEYTYLKVADITTYSREESNGSYTIKVLYGFESNARSSAFLAALGLTYSDNDFYKDNVYYFTSDALNAALSTVLNNNATTAKNGLENFIKSNGGVAMPLTDENGHTGASSLPLGLYLLVETKTPDLVTTTTNPFLLSLPMTTIDGNEWNYAVTVYPKSYTGLPSLEKTVREAKADTGKNNGSTTDINDGYAHMATASDGDILNYQLMSHMPTITSEASYLTCYTYVDELAKGITYSKNDVLVEFFRDAGCTDKITTWRESDSKFTVTYTDSTAGSKMTIEMTADGLREINTSASVYNTDSLYHGYSECYMRITYNAKINSNSTVVYGDKGNPNTVRLTWKRTSSDYYDILENDCHVFTYGLDLTKTFSDGAGSFANVKFVLRNQTDGYFITAVQIENTYYVTGHVTEEAQATIFVPTSSGHIILKGIEDDTYIVTEVETDSGYTLLRDNITLTITTADGEVCAVCRKAKPTASAKVNNDAITMLAEGSSNNAIAPFTVVNTKGFNLPQTGSHGIWMYTAFGVALMGLAVLLFALTRKKKSMQ